MNVAAPIEVALGYVVLVRPNPPPAPNWARACDAATMAKTAVKPTTALEVDLEVDMVCPLDCWY
jgi:hypothetical protein